MSLRGARVPNNFNGGEVMLYLHSGGTRKILSSVPIVQDGDGRFYGITRYGPYLALPWNEFDKYRVRLPYGRFARGSHYTLKALAVLGGGNQYAVDFRAAEGSYITSKRVGKVIYGGKGYVVVEFGIWQVCFVHVHKFARVGSVIPAGTPLCYVAPKSVSGVAPHLHVYITRKRKSYRLTSLLSRWMEQDV